MSAQPIEEPETVIAHIRTMPDFTHKEFVIERLQTRNVNRYQEALLKLNELIVQDRPDMAAGLEAVSADKIQNLITRIARLESSGSDAE